MTVLDSGKRTEFASGAVRDCNEGKGRCDLLPLRTIEAIFFGHNPFLEIMDDFQHNGSHVLIRTAVLQIIKEFFNDDKFEAVFELSKHYEDGAKKYPARNWQIGIDSWSFVSSAVRHYIKHMRGDTDERHDRACLWNLIGLYWTCEEKPELNEYSKHIFDVNISCENNASQSFEEIHRQIAKAVGAAFNKPERV